MKPNTTIEINALVDMLEAESNSERDHYFSELNSPLSELCKSSDALGPLIIKEQGAKNKIRLTGSIYYSRFRPGEWYRIENNYLEKISKFLDPYCIDLPILEDCHHKKEAEYNQYISGKNSSNIICLDKKNIATSGNVEPCDLLILDGGEAILVHVKISTRSSSLSHLFNQGINSI